jgi:hypothetical protein
MIPLEIYANRIPAFKCRPFNSLVLGKGVLVGPQIRTYLSPLSSSHNLYFFPWQFIFSQYNFIRQFYSDRLQSSRMANIAPTYEQRQEWREKHLQLSSGDSCIFSLPKIELHVHIEGTMTPELRWKLSERHGILLTCGSQKHPLKSLEETKRAYTRIRGRIGAASADTTKNFTFFEAYYGGFDLLRTEEDYYDLAMGYFEIASKMNVRYCEPFFDPQGHTRRGIAMDVVMKGFSRAQSFAETYLNVSYSL